ncbi:hypothetical protein P4O66_019114 [Electrophorus voltai]|uniref:Uncharacterized protein n=1 Tax=Electrophorus voltai TaxID=2609070 RepID=A0AAD8YNC1_9TELE|nr:hypothetical protein P4O66_019114 [Electrophorus voltai]
MDCGRRNRTAFRIQIEKVHGVICSESGLSALEEKHLAKRARHSQEDDCYYVQEMFDPVRVTHFSEGSSILEDTTDSDGDISEREVCYCATAQEKGPTNGFTRSGPWVPQNSTTIVCAGYVSPHPVCLAWGSTTEPPTHITFQYPCGVCHGAIPQGTAIGVTASAIAVHLHIVDASGPAFRHLLLHLLYKYLTLTSCHMQHHFRWYGVSGTGTV